MISAIDVVTKFRSSEQGRLENYQNCDPVFFDSSTVDARLTVPMTEKVKGMMLPHERRGLRLGASWRVGLEADCGAAGAAGASTLVVCTHCLYATRAQT